MVGMAAQQWESRASDMPLELICHFSCVCALVSPPELALPYHWDSSVKAIPQVSGKRTDDAFVVNCLP